MSETYDDILPVSLFMGKDGSYLLDLHNDVIATFDKMLEVEEIERIVKLINGEQRGGYAATEQE